MNNTNEPLSAILAEIRAARNTSSDMTLVWSNWLDDWADRIERTAKNTENAFGMVLAINDGLHKRDKLSAPGNAAFMREAMTRIKNVANAGNEHCATKAGALDSVYDLASAALADPPRNCDRTKDEAEDLFKERFGRPWTQTEDELAAWLFAPMNENGGNKQ